MSPAVAENPQSPADRARRTAPGIATLTVRSDHRPPWLCDDRPIRVPVPEIPRTLPETCEPIVQIQLPDGNTTLVIAETPDGPRLAADWNRWQRHVLLEHYAGWKRRPLHTHSPVSYRHVPPVLRRNIALRGRGRANGSSDFPALPFETGFVILRDIIRRLFDIAQPMPPAICLTHDIDTADGFKWASRIAGVEASLGFRSSWNVVAGDYPIDYGVLDELYERGFEIGLHGLKHDNRLIYLSEARMRARLDQCRPLIDRYKITGFRSPSWLRNESLYRVLTDYVSYDCSALDFDRYCPAGPGGVLTAEPFMIGSLVELPTTIPFDSPDFTGADPAGIVDFWRPKIRWLADTGGCAIVSTHPDPPFSGNERRLTAYRLLLEELKSSHPGRPMLARDLAQLTRNHAPVRV